MFEKMEDRVGVRQDDTLWVLEVGVDIVLEFEGVGGRVWELEGVDA